MRTPVVAALTALMLGPFGCDHDSDPPPPEEPDTECLPHIRCGCFHGCEEVVCDGNMCTPPPVEGRMGGPGFRLRVSEGGARYLGAPTGENCYATCPPSEPPACRKADGQCRPVDGR